jgi:adenylosuccinate lyase
MTQKKCFVRFDLLFFIHIHIKQNPYKQNHNITYNMTTTSDKLSIFDGRYRNSSEWLMKWFTEDEYIKVRYQVECAWLDTLCEQLPRCAPDDPHMPQVPADYKEKLNRVRESCDVSRIRELERETKHDVKAIELYLKERLAKEGEGIPQEWVHMCLTSQDVNSLAQSIILSNAVSTLTDTTRAHLNKFLKAVNNPHGDWYCEMLTHTHGQPAVPTTLNRELCNHMTRIYTTLNRLDTMELTYKFGGAIGNWAAGTYAFPEISPDEWEKRFFCNVSNPIKYPTVCGVEFPGLRLLTRSGNTTQTDDYSSYYRILNELCLFMRQIRAFADYIRDLIHDNYLVQKPIATETGSSTMPQKVNPIHFENVKANTELAIAVMRSIADTIMMGEYQRDMSDSTALRSLSTAFGYMGIVIDQLRNGLDRIHPNPEHMRAELARHPEVIMEAVQTVCRRYNLAGAYEQAKDFARRERSTPLTLEQIRSEFIAKIVGLPDAVRIRLLELKQEYYLGVIYQPPNYKQVTPPIVEHFI